MPALVLVKSQERQAALETLLHEALRVDYGHRFTYAELEALTGLTRKALQDFIRRDVNPKLLEAKRMLLCVRRSHPGDFEGIEVATPPDQMKHAHGRRLKAGRQYGWAAAELQGLDVTRLSPDEQVRYQHLLNYIADMLARSKKKTVQGIQQSERALTRQREAAAILTQMQAQLSAALSEVQAQLSRAG